MESKKRGRPKKEKREANPETISYIKQLSKQYADNRDYYTHFESHKKSFIARSGLNIRAFDTEGYPDPSVFKIRVKGADSVQMLQKYLTAREQVFLLEQAVNAVSDSLRRSVVYDRYILRLPRLQISKKHNLAMRTMERYQQQSLIEMSEFIENFFCWKESTLNS